MSVYVQHLGSVCVQIQCFIFCMVCLTVRLCAFSYFKIRSVKDKTGKKVILNWVTNKVCNSFMWSLRLLNSTFLNSQPSFFTYYIHILLFTLHKFLSVLVSSVHKIFRMHMDHCDIFFEWHYIFSSLMTKSLISLISSNNLNQACVLSYWFIFTKDLQFPPFVF